jgi:antitoxin component YwqK of YwqJK toxin-antitoxin module
VVNYHDPYTKQHVQEKYRVSTTAPYLKEGLYEQFAGDGNIIKSVTYKAGQKNGPEVLYTNMGVYWCGGKPVEQNNWKNDNLDGLQKKYGCHDSNSGTTVYDGLVEESLFKDGVVIWTKTYYTGSKKKANIQLNGPCTEWYESGAKSAEYTFKNGQMEGEFTAYYESGAVKQKQTFTDGQRVGDIITTYYESGKKSEECTYVTGTQRKAKATTYYESGSVKEELTYEGAGPGALKKAVEMTEGGKIRRETVYTYNSAYVTEYDAAGNKIESNEEKQGRQQAEKENKRKAEADKKKQFENELESQRVNINQKYDKFTSLYASTKTTEIMAGVSVGNYPKGKHLYEKGDALYMEYAKAYSNEQDISKKVETGKTMMKVLDRLISLASTDTKEINKQLKKAETQDEVKQILGL